MSRPGQHSDPDTHGNAWLAVVMPAHNEAEHLEACLASFVQQTRPPNELLVVDDHSTDATAEIAAHFAASHSWIHVLRIESDPGHRPGAKVVRAFRRGLEHLSRPFDLIGKFDADLVLPPDYFERVLEAFGGNPGLGMCSGLVYIWRQGEWTYEPIANRDHVRGPVKLYSAACFGAIGGLRPAVGWDTADVLLARYHGFGVETLEDLRVKHLRPTGSAYSKENALRQGETLYTLRYGMVLGLLASLKMAWKRQNPSLPWLHVRGCLQAQRRGAPRLLSAAEGRFARRWRWAQIRRTLV
ncbi:MAG TPA: glycosyltransferase family 2 protein [Robiginitalea sp.]|nr:glycosyltransferase family 2 protein [Robiginitalea sp.]